MIRTSLLRLTAAGIALTALPAAAVDHNNIDARRPLSFDDADSLAYREQALEFGLGLGLTRRRALGIGMAAEYLYGYQMNSHLSVGLDPTFGGRARDRDTRFDLGAVSVGWLRNFNRQHGRTPAFALRADLLAPTGIGGRGVGFRLRGIATRQAGRYGRAHLNLDLNGNPGAGGGERDLHGAMVLGYSRPLGYPTRFATTGLAELSVRQGEDQGTGPGMGVGLGLRKQVGVLSVVDVGLQTDLVGWNGSPRDRVRFVVGYSRGF